MTSRSSSSWFPFRKERTRNKFLISVARDSVASALPGPSARSAEPLWGRGRGEFIIEFFDQRDHAAPGASTRNFTRRVCSTSVT